MSDTTHPKIGAEYTHHKNNGVYVVEGIANVDSTRSQYPPTVIYRGVSNGKLWTKPVARFNTTMNLKSTEGSK